MPRDYESDPLNYSGFENRQYKSGLLQLAFTKPSEYYKLQETVLNKILADHIKDIYKTVYNALRRGQTKSGQPIVNVAADFATYSTITTDWNPKLPDEDCDKIAKQVTKDLEAALEKHIIDRVLPPNIFNDALKRSATKAAAGIDTT